MEKGQSTRSQLYKAEIYTSLSLPRKIFGVTAEFLMIETMIITIAFMFLSDISIIYVLLIAFPLHIGGVIICRIDIDLFPIIFVNANLQNAKTHSIEKVHNYEA
ncbi:MULTISPECIES: VirB3 family type IV secretion system protein [Francisellaceae]|uniref:VirB3 family type IV secretion system protein n=1 Tax=Francisellaceae TaxID=34064 RepID=UPI0019053691|nr:MULTISPECIES: VirB3 family type IV secretion system protein [Francisellaceae]MBK2046060.1 VirB3 family type IV secretion system protein [Allofrancisella guangzhouensis]MBK2257583.1 VirB3 family type IV secretion system protein [Francisella philomiragia]MBK2270297.1 VirB3 family type IV secretion system protein [Francisella philomiragia]MBK2272101.1 VirB3 family type IV secretion system protein [Francisella philomiragia]MBK2275940.1 VirB3 family type IV secretion system protein [Francisella 